MTSNSWSANELDIRAHERNAELEKANKELRAEIFECKRAEEAFRESEEKYRNIIEAVNEGIWVIDPEARITFANQKMVEILGYTLDEMIGKYPWDFTDEESKPIIKKNFERRILGIDESYESKFISKDGSPLWVFINAKSSIDKDGKFAGSMGTLTDITKHKQAEDKLRYHANLIDNVSDAIISTDKELKIKSWNKAAERMYGWQADEVIGMKGSDVLQTRFPEEFNRRAITRDIFEKGCWEGELIQKTKDGRDINVYGKSVTLKDESGVIIGGVSISSDITERKKVEEALRKSENEFRTLAENSPDLITRLDKQRRYIYINSAAAKSYGITQEAVIGKTNAELGLIPEKVKCWEKHFEEVFTTGKPKTIEYFYKSPEGRKYFFNTQIVPEFINGEVTSILAISRDITGIKDTEVRLKETLDNLENLVKERTAELDTAYQSLKESEKGLADAQKMAHLGNWTWDLVTGEVYWSDELYRIFGRDPQKSGASHEELLNYVHPDSRDYVDKTIKGRLNGEISNGIDYHIIQNNGEERIVHSLAEVTCSEQNTPVRVNGIVQDVTEQRLASKKLQESEERYRIAAEQTGQLVFDFRQDTQRIEWAGAIREITGYDPEEFKSFGESFWVEYIHPEDREKMIKSKREFFRKLQNIREEFRLRKKDGNYVYLEIRGVWLKDEDGRVSRAIGIIKDITERKQTEEFLTNIESARQKEIHHRIKNNLQVIYSLLDLQAERFNHRKCIDDSEVLEAFRESKDRVMSIALIHEELHEGESNNALNFSLYLQRLIENLFRTYRIGSTDIKLDMNLEGNIFFDMDTAVPLGMIVNELISNSLKYAFPDRENGEIKIKLSREETEDELNDKEQLTGKGSYTLVVSDNGAGIPENIDFENPETLGMQLVNILADQLEAEIELRRGKGTEYVIRFSNIEK